MAQRVLVVDDEEGIRSFLAEVLAGEGHEVAVAADGREALALIGRQSFHLMITDLKMPGMDGMELFRRAAEIAPETEVIVLTAHGTVETAVEAMKLGAADYLTKPLSGPDELRIVAARALERRRMRDERQRIDAGRPDEDLVARDPAIDRKSVV
jgi:two-component system, NtrC family, response regulator AtoC